MPELARGARSSPVRLGCVMRLGSRRGGAAAIAALIAGLTATALWSPRPLLVWNATASAPMGLYGITAPREIVAGDMVIARLPARWRGWAGERHYIPVHVPMVKRVAAVSGESICAWGRAAFINGRLVAMRKDRDGRGRAMPWWEGCHLLRGGEVFLLTADPSSFDGRYFGPTARSDIIGRARLLWAR